MKRAAVLSIVVVVVLLALGVTAEAQQPKKVPRIGYLTPAEASSVSPSVPTQFGLLCVSVATSKDRTSPSSTDLRRGSEISSLSLRPSWCVSTLGSS